MAAVLFPEMDGIDVLHKRIKTTHKGKEGSEGDGGGEAVEAAVETEMTGGSEEMEASIQRILEKIDLFTHRVSELLEAGKALFKVLGEEFEERLIAIHREHLDKWQDEIKELRMIDASNETARVRLQNAQFHLLQECPRGLSVPNTL